ncbi:MAG: 2-amino-4-hydroxy-6-hydroxymethyldihydropteridine diphosphokinase [Cyclobacteriaceae bacterium]|nr:2-amino-4-hydroxy-6-hydroxymethyldihydropteridine diphosphokinase [Cyclobacteriaceae bacterium]
MLLRICLAPDPKKASSVYETAAWGNTQQAAFLNQVIELETKLAPTALLRELLTIETHLGRIRKKKWGKRTIDIDILYYGNSIIQEPELIIPHPEIAKRRFTLVPLDELTPDLIDPVSGKSVRQMLSECKDTLEVSVF